MARKSRKNIDSTTNNAVPASTQYHAAAYIRLSCDDTKKRGDSLETQRNIIENYIAAAPGIRLVEVYSDNNMTGTNFERTGFQRMLADVHCGKINCIIVKDLTRFGRNAIDGGYYLEKYLPMLRVRFIAITDAYDSNDPDSGILLPLKQIINEGYALDIGRKVRAVHRQNIADGRYVGRLAPYGYRKSPEDCHKLIPDEETAPIVRQIYHLACSGVSACEIARRLSAAGVPSPARHNYAKGFNKSEKLLGTVYWKPNTVKGILSDRIYLGDMVQGKTHTVNGKQNDIDPSEWVCVPDTHEPIISRDVFDRVQVLRQAVHEKSSAIKTTPFSPNLFKGKILCSHCGRPMHRKRQNKDGVYWYRCESQNRYGKNTCHIVSVREADIYSSILDTLRGQTTDVLGKYVSLEKISVAAKSHDGAPETELREINRELGNTGNFLRSLYESLVDDLITPEEYVRMKSEYEAKIESLSQRADEIRGNISKANTDLNEYYGFADAVSLAACDISLNADIVDAVVEKILVRYDKTFEVLYRFEHTRKEAF